MVGGLDDLDALVEKGALVGVQDKIDNLGPDVAGLQELIVYGLKGLAAYADHAQILGKEDDAIYAFIHKTLDRLTQKPTDIGELLQTALAPAGSISRRWNCSMQPTPGLRPSGADTGSHYPRQR